MRNAFVIAIVILSFLTSCYEVYIPDIDTNTKVLVVNGLMTDKKEAYHIILSYANPFNTMSTAEQLSNAMVYVTDDAGNQYLFIEKSGGNYSSDSSQFTGIPGHNYKLHIIAPNGDKYESENQQLLPESNTDKVYAAFDTKETLDRTSGLTVLTHGANILADITTDSISHYRFTSNLVIQYYFVTLLWPRWDLLLHFDHYCWQSANINPNINLTGGEYTLNSASIRKHPICFVDDNSRVWAKKYGVALNMGDTTGSLTVSNYYQFYEIHGRILYLAKYNLNKETYSYYKALDEQLQAQGKLFDPIASQLNGNIKCTSDPKKKAIGFFETSSVNYSAYTINFRNLDNSQPSLIKTPYTLPPSPNGCQIELFRGIHYNIPEFWIFN